MGRRKRGTAVIVVGLAVACTQAPSRSTAERSVAAKPTKASEDDHAAPVAGRVTQSPVAGELDVSSTHACLLTRGGELWCWGENRLGQLGVRGARRMPVRAPIPQAIADVALGFRFTCVCDGQGSVYCWDNRNYAPAQQELPARPRPVAVAPCRAVVAGGLYACALSRDGTVDCWGQWPRPAWPPSLAAASTNPRGDLAWHDDPMTVQGLARVLTLVAGQSHVCAIDADWKLYCWGDNELGQLSDGVVRGHVVEVPLEHVVDVAVGSEETCAQSTAGLSCWGRDPVAVCPIVCPPAAPGLLLPCRRGMPVSVTGVPGVTGPRAGLLDTCGLTSTGDLVCWGMRWSQPSRTRRPRPREPTVDGRGVVTFDIEGDSGCLLNEQGEVRCWGPILGAPWWRDGSGHRVPDELLSPPGAVVLEIHGDHVEPRELP